MKNMATAIVVFALAAAGALAQTGGTGIAPSQDATGANERLLEELRQITEEAERNRSASTGVIGQLRDLARRYAWPWNRLIASDEFDDRNFTQNPAWTVISGTFTPAYGELISRHTPPTTAATQQNPSANPNDLGATIFGAVLQGLSQANQAQTAPSQPLPAQAQIRLNAQTPNAFAAVVTLRTQSIAPGGFEFGLGREPAGSGYRLNVTPDIGSAAGTASLVRVGAAGSAIVDRVNLPAGWNDGQDYVFELTRDTTGDMAIGLNGVELIRVRDMGIRDDFDRFLFVNYGGEYRIQSVAIYGTF
jgi:hypothetical protein